MMEAPDETTPHINAHIGGNHVTGLVSCTTSRIAGMRINAGYIVDSDIAENYAGSAEVSNYLDNKIVHATANNL